MLEIKNSTNEVQINQRNTIRCLKQIFRHICQIAKEENLQRMKTLFCICRKYQTNITAFGNFEEGNKMVAQRA